MFISKIKSWLFASTASVTPVKVRSPRMALSQRAEQVAPLIERGLDTQAIARELAVSDAVVQKVTRLIARQREVHQAQDAALGIEPGPKGQKASLEQLLTQLEAAEEGRTLPAPRLPMKSALHTARSITGGARRGAQKSNQFARTVGPVIEELRCTGQTLDEIARELDRRGVKTARGGKWGTTSVSAALVRYTAIKKESN
jgi:hypothetical protein